MAPWDKPEWYTRTEYLKDKKAFFSGNGEKRFFMICLAKSVRLREIECFGVGIAVRAFGHGQTVRLATVSAPRFGLGCL